MVVEHSLERYWSSRLDLIFFYFQICFDKSQRVRRFSVCPTVRRLYYVIHMIVFRTQAWIQLKKILFTPSKWQMWYGIRFIYFRCLSRAWHKNFLLLWLIVSWILFIFDSFCCNDPFNKCQTHWFLLFSFFSKKSNNLRNQQNIECSSCAIKKRKICYWHRCLLLIF